MNVIRARFTAWWTMRISIPVGALFLARQALREMKGES